MMNKDKAAQKVEIKIKAEIQSANRLCQASSSSAVVSPPDPYRGVIIQQARAYKPYLSYQVMTGEYHEENIIRDTSHRPNREVLALASRCACKADAIIKAQPNNQQAFPITDINTNTDDTVIFKEWDDSWHIDSYQSIQDTKRKVTYFATLFRNDKTRQMVLAFRGSKSPEDWQTDLCLVRLSLDAHIACALAHGLDAYEKARGLGYRLTFTGHSLGGALAIVSYYLIRRQFINVSDCAAVGFDNPGMYEYLTEFQPTNTNYKVNLEELDVTSYLSGAVNPINSLGTQFGSVFALVVVADPQKLPGIPNTAAGYAKKSHTMSRLILAFDLKTGELNDGWQLLRMKSWPRILFRSTIKESPHAFAAIKPEAKSAYRSIVGKVKGLFRKNSEGETSSAPQIFTDAVENNQAGWPLARALFEWATVGKGFLKLAGKSLEDGSYIQFREYANADSGYTIPEIQDVYRESATLNEKFDAIQKLFATRWEPDAHHLGENFIHTRHLPLALVKFLEKWQDTLREMHDSPVTFQPLYKSLKKEHMELLEILGAPLQTQGYVYRIDQQGFLAIYANTDDVKKDIVQTLINPLANYILHTDNALSQCYQGLLVEVACSSQVDDEAKRTSKHLLGKLLHREKKAYKNVYEDLRKIQSQSRLYLFGAAPAEEIEALHAMRESLTHARTTYSKFLERAQLIDKKTKNQDVLLTRLESHYALITIAKHWAEGLYYLKQRQPKRLINSIQAILGTNSKVGLLTAEQAEVLDTDARVRNTISSAEIKACSHQLLGKAYRQQINPSAAEESEWKKIEYHYLKALEYFENAGKLDVPVPSSLAALYADVGLHDKAFEYHYQAMALLPALENCGNRGKKIYAITHSNMAWSYYWQGKETDNISKAITLFKKAEKLLNTSLKVAPNGGSYWYRACVYLELAHRDESKREAYKQHALNDLNAGLDPLMEQHSAKLLLERAKFYNAESQLDQSNFGDVEELEKLARQDAARVTGLYDNTMTLIKHPEYEQYVEDAESIIDRIESIDHSASPNA
jgi:Lipase (class 3)